MTVGRASPVRPVSAVHPGDMDGTGPPGVECVPSASHKPAVDDEHGTLPISGRPMA